MKIYLDTNLWNEFLDQGVDPARLIVSLAEKGANVVLSYQTTFELAKTFTNDAKRGKRLFCYVKEFVLAAALCTKEISGVLEAEMLSLRSPTVEMSPFLSPENYNEFRLEVEKLASGDFDQQATEFIASRSALGLAVRSGAPRHLSNRTDVIQRLRNVAPSHLEQWMKNEVATPQGVMLMTEQITRQFPDAPLKEAVSWASPLLASPACRLAGGLVRADLYYNWRCSHRGSLPKDLYHDMYHVLNATYCDVYATKELGQREYAGLLLTPKTRIAIYNGRDSLDSWLRLEAQA
jgi:hypothetical protein